MCSEPRIAPGILVVIAGPSGAGKTTLAHHLVKTFPDARFSVSTTTRSLRGEEVHGEDYFFVEDAEFEQRLADGYFVEWAEVHGERYGTSAEWVRRTLAGGKSVILDIDVQGAIQVKRVFPGSILVFVLPPSPSVLMKRLVSRNTDSPGIVRNRLHAAEEEISWIGSFDYYILNDCLSNSLNRIEAIFMAESSRLKNLPLPPQVRAYGPERFHGLDQWKGSKVIVTSGPTREFVDEVRFISNRSSGLMGTGMAEAFRDGGADVVFITGPCCHSDPSSVRTIRVTSATEMLNAVRREISGAELLVMTAAVSDLRPASRRDGKMERGGGITLDMESTPDILASLQDDLAMERCRVLAFALEYGGEALSRASAKMRRKGASMLFMNRGDQIGSGMETHGNSGFILFDNGSSIEVPQGSKRIVAALIAAAAGRYLQEDGGLLN